MDIVEKLSVLKSLTDIKDDTQELALLVYLDLAGRKIINKAFPYGSTQTDVPQKYEYLQCEIAAYLWNKRGAEGEISHSENGITRSYENADVPVSMLRDVTPYCGVI